MKPTIVGWREYCRLPDLYPFTILAKIDTGAWSSTLHAANIEIIEGDIETRVRFNLEEGGPVIERPLEGWRRVRPTSGHETLRPTIRTDLEFGGGHDHDIEICLADRSSMRHRLILGRSFLRRGYIVNPSRQAIHGEDRSESRVRVDSSD
ncbi:MAG TPA: RimK/LysX family protein [Candidatus Thalassarchaeaceae archaeon]|jgi:hypothetical protein|nr:RimK/LysX family protein [Candidatus Thalassarchaeaceae archaeon]HJM77185.1 RimK/LysX family protein [Candidatus Thalassarchaeaceae archaeon]|tara:strand:+ start:178 stop:627 length:450 start_codon:yes stop_codon:yes gene_type:complete